MIASRLRGWSAEARTLQTCVRQHAFRSFPLRLTRVFQRGLSSASVKHRGGQFEQQHEYLVARRPQGLQVVENFVTAEEEEALLKLAQEIMGDRQYQMEHFDSVISGYRECFVDRFFDPKVATVVDRMRAWAWHETQNDESRGDRMFPHIQMIDMLPEGMIKAHCDNTKIFGAFTCGLNLSSEAVMRFEHTKAQKRQRGDHSPYDCRLPRRSCYLMSQDARWNYTHSILASQTECAAGRHVRNGRLSIIVRDVGPVDPEGPKWRQVIHGLFPSLPVSWLPVYPPAPRPSSTTVHGK